MFCTSSAVGADILLISSLTACASPASAALVVSTIDITLLEVDAHRNRRVGRVAAISNIGPLEESPSE
jgi:hypothetical protein